MRSATEAAPSSSSRAAIEGMAPDQWGRFIPGADWRPPEGPESSIDGRDDYPVVQVTVADAEAYARGAGRELPSVEQWERAARGLQKEGRARTAWAYDADGKPQANTWQGLFPIKDLAEDGYAGMAPVGCFPANDFGLHDMVGNVWEWTTGGAGPGSRTVKGGSFLCAANYCSNFRPAGFQAQEANFPTSHIGFRTIERQQD